MSVRNTIKMLTLAGAATAVLPGVASAANPTFGDWSATGGAISNTGANCPTGFTCEVTISGDGFLQSTVTEDVDPSNVFVQTIVTDTGATGTAASLGFSDENYVKTDGTSNGIAARQTANDTASNFTGSVEVNTGWALVGGAPSIDINQAFTDDPDGTASTGDEFSNSFGIAINLDATGAQTGKSMDIDQSVALGNATDKQDFAIRQRSGDELTTTGSLTLDGGTPVSWSAGDDVMVAWIGQQVDIGASGSSLFGFESVTNATTATTDSTFSTTATDVTTAPFDWDATTFGTAPSL